METKKKKKEKKAAVTTTISREKDAVASLSSGDNRPTQLLLSSRTFGLNKKERK